MAVQRTAEDVASMQTELFDLRLELEDTKRLLTIATTERNSLKIELALLQRRSDDNLEKATRMESIMTHVSAGLVAGLNQMKEERVLHRALRREGQEHLLQVGSTTEPAPVFIAPRQRDHFQETQDETDVARAEQLRGAAERVAPPVLAVRPGRVDHTLADRDPRLPPAAGLMRDPLPRTDDENLRDLFGSNMQTTRR